MPAMRSPRIIVASIRAAATPGRQKGLANRAGNAHRGSGAALIA
jgi:hypothetical protein